MCRITSMLRGVAVCLVLEVLLMGCGTVGERAGKSGTAGENYGKLYLVGMGTAPDLITVRGVKAIKSADIIVVHDPEALEDWKEYIGKKEAWVFERYNLLFFGSDPNTLEEPADRAIAEEYKSNCYKIVQKIRSEVEKGKTVAILENGDAMMYGESFYLELLPKDFPSEVVPGVGSFQAASAAVKMSPPYGWDTSAVILTMSDWDGRVDTNEKLMEAGATMVFYTMHLDYDKVFNELKRHYPENTPVAIVCNAGNLEQQKVITSTIGSFFDEVDLESLPPDAHLMLVGKFLTSGQARKDGLLNGRKFIEMMRYKNREQSEEN